MAPLPAKRTRPTRPFKLTGVDCVGPFLIKSSPDRGQKAFKGYLVIFISSGGSKNVLSPLGA